MSHTPPHRYRQRVIANFALGVCVLAAGGCAVSLRAVTNGEQIVLDDGKSALQERDKIELVAQPVSVPWSDSDGPAAMKITTTNFSDAPCYIEVESMYLEDDSQRRYPAKAPQLLREAFAGGGSDYLDQPIRIHVSYGCWYGYGPGYGPYGWWDPYPSYYDDAYYERRRVRVFIANLLTSRIVEPHESVEGNVVFDLKIDRDSRVTLVVPIRSAQERARAGEPPASRGTT